MWNIKFFNNEKPRDAQPATELYDIARTIEPLIENMVLKVFMTYKKELLSQDITYIVPAVWGAKKDGDLTASQVKISREVGEALKQVMDHLNLAELSPAQEYAMGYILRSLIISKVTYMIEGTKSLLMQEIASNQKTYGNLMEVEAIGQA